MKKKNKSNSKNLLPLLNPQCWNFSPYFDAIFNIMFFLSERKWDSVKYVYWIYCYSATVTLDISIAVSMDQPLSLTALASFSRYSYIPKLLTLGFTLCKILAYILPLTVIHTPPTPNRRVKNQFNSDHQHQLFAFGTPATLESRQPYV